MSHALRGTSSTLGSTVFTPAGFAGVQRRAFCTPLRSLKQRRINMKIKTKVRGGSLDRGC